MSVKCYQNSATLRNSASVLCWAAFKARTLSNKTQLYARFARHSEKGKKTRKTEEEVGRQHQDMDRFGVRQVPEGLLRDRWDTRLADPVTRTSLTIICFLLERLSNQVDNNQVEPLLLFKTLIQKNNSDSNKIVNSDSNKIVWPRHVQQINKQQLKKTNKQTKKKQNNTFGFQGVEVIGTGGRESETLHPCSQQHKTEANQTLKCNAASTRSKINTTVYMI